MPKGRLTLDVLVELLSSPRAAWKAALLAWRTSVPGLKGRALSAAYLAEAAVLAPRLRRAGVTHLHNHMGFNSAAVAMLASILTGIPYSLTIHGPDEFDAPAAAALGTKISRSAFTVAISAFCRSQLMRWTPAECWDRIHVVRCGVAPSFASGAPSPVPDAPAFVCVGRLEPAKGLHVLIEAVQLAAVRGRRARLDVIGDGSLRAELEREIARRGVQDAVRLWGWRSSRQVREHILSSRALVLPSFAEGLPIVLMEAMALHRPVIATRIAGIPELVRPGENGWLVSPGSARELSDAMIAAADADGATLARMGRAGAAAVAAEHDAHTQARRLERLFEEHCRARVGAAAGEREGLATGVA
jgi:glycosyltransferase involved in cell wall biosynthesis